MTSRGGSARRPTQVLWPLFLALASLAAAADEAAQRVEATHSGTPAHLPPMPDAGRGAPSAAVEEGLPSLGASAEGPATPAAPRDANRSDTASAPTGPWSPTQASPFPEALRSALQAVVEDAREGGPPDGLSVAVLHGDRAWLAAFGLARLSPPLPATTRTSYRIGSVTKTFTATAVLQLAARGALSLDEDVRHWVPRFPPKAWPLTWRELLGHTAGVGWYRGPKDAWTTKPTTTDQALDLFRHRPLVFEPGTAFLYSSFGYVLLGAALEKAAGAPYGVHLERTLFGPLGLEQTGLEASEKTRLDRAQGYRLARGALVPARALDLSSRFSSGGLRSTVEDLARWVHALPEGQVVDAATWRAMTTPGVTSVGEVTDYGLGFAVYPVRGRKVVAHAGGVPGGAALVLLIPEERFAVVLLSNLQNRAGGGLMALATRLSEVVLDDGLPRRGWYADERAEEVAFDGLNRVMSHGLMRFRDPAPPAGAEERTAFASMEALFAPAALAADPEAARLALKEASHPRHGRVSAVAGAEMARWLAGHGASLEDYSSRGPIAFFSDYLKACEDSPCPHPLGPALAATARTLAERWAQTPEVLRTLRREQLDGAPGVAEALEALAGQPAHVDLVEDLTYLAWRQRARGALQASQATLALSAQLHPASPLAQLALAEAAALDGDPQGAAQGLRAAALLPRGPIALSRDLVKTRAEALEVGATPPGVAALELLVARARALLPPAGGALLRARDTSPVRPAPDGEDLGPKRTAGRAPREAPAP